MLRRIYFSSFLFVIVILVFFAQTAIAQERIKECTVPNQHGIRYKLISIGRTIREPEITGLRIVVNNKHFNKDYMVQLTAIIKAKYCNEEMISVVIFDDAKAARQAKAVVDQLAENRKVPELRGFYSIDRKTGEESLSFSAKRGNPPDEISLQLPND